MNILIATFALLASCSSPEGVVEALQTPLRDRSLAAFAEAGCQVYTVPMEVTPVSFVMYFHDVRGKQGNLWEFTDVNGVTVFAPVSNKAHYNLLNGASMPNNA